MDQPVWPVQLQSHVTTRKQRPPGEANNSTPDKVIVKPDHLKSAVWRFFGFWSVEGEAVHKSKAVCKLCDYVGISLHYQKI